MQAPMIYGMYVVLFFLYVRL